MHSHLSFCAWLVYLRLSPAHMTLITIRPLPFAPTGVSAMLKGIDNNVCYSPFRFLHETSSCWLHLWLCWLLYVRQGLSPLLTLCPPGNCQPVICKRFVVRRQLCGVLECEPMTSLDKLNDSAWHLWNPNALIATFLHVRYNKGRKQLSSSKLQQLTQGSDNY